MVNIKDYQTEAVPNWCPGCGNFSIMVALKKALVELNIKPENVVIVTGIGCGSKFPYWINTFGFHTIHGRSLPVAAGVKLANNDLTVIAMGGDGDGYGIGVGHFVHALRRNVNMAYLVQNNSIYGLTKGQASPTTELGKKTSSTPFGNPDHPINPLKLSIGGGATFVARAFTADVNFMTEIIKAAIKHKGFAHVDLLQPCVTFNDTYDYYKKRVYKLDKKHDVSDIKKAWQKALECEKNPNKIATGIFYQVNKQTYEDNLPQIKKKSLVKQNIENINIDKILKRFV